MVPRRASLAVLLLSSLPACGSGAGRVAGSETLPTTGLVARFEAPAGPIASTTSGELAYTLENRGPAAATVDLDVLGTAIFSLDVTDSSGQRVLTIPPGPPPPDYVPRRMTLAPGARRRFVLNLNVFSPPLPAGDYTAKIHGTHIASETLHFRVSPGGS